ncbi:hypothetical protein SSX86_015287 [Deinandra increscens subsp. villosa]|uniref:Uncharacterized protein n=1 Tax=Deinandra increscens subsp. villosa TaxID=3103831 RepID=A0AAP0D4A9_9ASTR
MYQCCRRACVESVFWVMPLTKLVADALGVVTISLVAVLGIIGFLCILYSFYFRSHIRSQGYNRLGYFAGPWVIRVIFILFSIWWGFGEILRLEFLRQDGRVLHTLNLKWQEIVCKCYIMSNLGFAEPCLFLTLVFLLRASLQKTESGPLSQNWNLKTTIYVLLCCFPMFALQLTVVLVGPHYKTDMHMHTNKWGYFFRITSDYQNDVARCYYPLMSTIFLAVFDTMLTLYLFLLGMRILSLVLSKGLQKRVLILIISISSSFPLRVLLLGLSVLSKPGETVFEVLAFLAFLSLLCCAALGVCMFVYFPIADSLALKTLQDIEDRRRIIEEHNDTLSLITDQDHDNLGKQGSLSFRAMEINDHRDRPAGFVELSLFSPSRHSTPVGSPQLLGWPMLPSSAQ